MNIEDYGSWVGVRENGQYLSNVFCVDLMQAVHFIRDKLPRGSTHWVGVHRDGNRTDTVRLGFRFFSDNDEEVIIVLKGRGAILSNGVIKLWPYNEGQIKLAMKKHLKPYEFEPFKKFFK